jgi:hypothetical protein
MNDFQDRTKLWAASSFADWVFRQLKGYRRSGSPSSEREAHEEQLMLFGRRDHEEIDQIAQRLRNEMIGSPSDYRVGFTDPDGAVFEAPSLRIMGKPLRGRPDLVLEHKTREHVIIVERKTSRSQRYFTTEETAIGNWVNIECQLWCYSHFAPWAQRERVTLIGEIWRHHDGVLVRALDPLVWQKEDEEHEAKCRKFFRHYARDVETGWIR